MTVRYETILLDKKDAVATVTFNRMDKLNACNATMFDELDAALTDVDYDNRIRVVVLTGQGGSFCVGGEVEKWDFGRIAQGMEFVTKAFRVFERFESIAKIAVAAVNGYAFGFGTEVTLACDIVLASDKAKFGLLEARHGLIPPLALLQGVEIVGKRNMAYLAMTGHIIDAHEAKSLGFVNGVIPHEQLMHQVYTLCDKLKAGPPLAQQAIKRILNRRSYEGHGLCMAMMPAILATEDMAEGRKAFLERRNPAFKGR